MVCFWKDNLVDNGRLVGRFREDSLFIKIMFDVGKCDDVM